MEQSIFTTTIVEWGLEVDRPMPWRGIRDPYRIWLSEIILQQTRVEQGRAYYERFVEAFPEVNALANAEEDKVMGMWQGLGYYSRARNLHKAAKVVRDAGGQFPKSYKDLLKLPGVGPYSAAAIASFAYHEPVAVLDGNVYRVLSRYFDVELPIDKPAGQKEFRKLADGQLALKQPAVYNQAIMDFGALMCTPKAPKCNDCPLQESCAAFANRTVSLRPQKAGKIKRRARYFDYLFVENDSGALLLSKRGAGDIWQGLYDCPVLESVGSFAERSKIENAADQLGLGRLELKGVSTAVKHVLSHQDLHVRFHCFQLIDRLQSPKITDENQMVDRVWFSSSALVDLGIPQLLKRFVVDRTLALDF